MKVSRVAVTMARAAPLLALLLLAVGFASAPASRPLGGYGLSLSLGRGWDGQAAPGELHAADFPLGAAVLASPERARVGRGHVHLIVWDYGPTVPYLAGNFPPARLPLALHRRDLTAGPLEGFSGGDVYALRSVAINGELLELVADFGPKPLAAASFQRLNRVLGTLRVRPPLVLAPSRGRLAAGGVALRLLPGWSGRIEIPAYRQAAQLVVRADRGDVHVVLLQLAGGQGAHADLPIILTAKNVLRRHGLLIARRVFSTAGRSFDLSVALASASELAEANRLLKTLTATPRSWTFRSCNLSLRLPGTWWAAINPRSGCYPVITLRAPHLRVVLTELRAHERASGRVLRRAGRRFRVQITPAAARPAVDRVLAGLHADARK
jgi:hypothetical protein